MVSKTMAGNGTELLTLEKYTTTVDNKHIIYT
jgi:hypothetical protein